MKKFGFAFDRQASGSHEIWFNSKTNKYTTIPNHSGDMPEGTLRAILRQADIAPNEKVTNLLANLKATAESDKNLLPAILECVENYITLGEISHCLRGVFGIYKE